jgi:hypothetical protein
MKKKLIKIFIVFHLTLILLAASHLGEIFSSVSFLRPIDYVSIFYKKFTFNNQRFVFFGPVIGKQLTASVICTDSSGRRFQYYFPLPNREMEVRFNKIQWGFWTGQKRTVGLKSWASYIKTRHPQVRSIEFNFYEHDMPSMREYRIGKRILPRIYYKTSVEV